MEELLEKYFKNKMCYFHSSDAHKNIEGDTYLTYKFYNGKMELYLGGDNGEICLCVSNDLEKIETLIKTIIH